MNTGYCMETNLTINFILKKKLWFIYTMEYYVAMRKNQIWPFGAMWIELESVMLSEINHTEKDRFHVFTPMWILRNLTEDHGGGEGKKTVREGGSQNIRYSLKLRTN